jgi:hypothetical protein
MLAYEHYPRSLTAEGEGGPDDAVRNAVYVATASATLAVMPAFDELAKEAGLNES